MQLLEKHANSHKSKQRFAFLASLDPTGLKSINDDAIDDNSHDDDSEIIFIGTRSDTPIANQVNFFDKEMEERMHRIELCRKVKEPPCNQFTREQAVNCHDMADSAETLQDGRLD